MSAVAVRAVPPAAWSDELAALHRDGWTMLDVLTAVDRIEEIEVVAHLLRPAGSDGVLVSTRVTVDQPTLASVVAVFPGAAWHEREAAEMFGIAFAGHPDPRPLLLHGPVDAPPLRKSTPLPARVATAWPGAAEPDPGRRARRPQPPPGVRAEWVREVS